MKSPLYFIIISLFLLSCSKSEEPTIPPSEQQKLPEEEIVTEKIHDGYVELKTQVEVNMFGELKYTQIEGGLKISGTDISDLTPLESLTKISGGGLTIIDNSILESLKGLQNLTSLGTQFANLIISGNDALTSLTGLEKLSDIAILKVEGNGTLTTISGLDNLKSVGSLSISGNLKLKSISGFNSLENIDGSFELYNNRELATLDGFQNLVSVDKDFLVTYNVELNSLEDFESLEHIGSNVEIASNDELIDLDGFKKITWLHAIEITKNSKLQNLKGLESLKTVEYIFGIAENPSLESINHLSNLISIGYASYIVENVKLTTLQGLENLEDSGSYRFLIKYNTTLTNLCSIQTLIQEMDDVSNIEIEFNLFNPTPQEVLNDNCAL